MKVGSIPEAAVSSLCWEKVEWVASLFLGFLCSYHAVYQSYPGHEAIATLFGSTSTSNCTDVHLCKCMYIFVHFYVRARMREGERESYSKWNFKIWWQIIYTIDKFSFAEVEPQQGRIRQTYLPIGVNARHTISLAKTTYREIQGNSEHKIKP